MPTAPQEPGLLVDREDGVVTLTLNRPAAMNALSRELRRAIATAFRSIADDAGASFRDPRCAFASALRG